MIQVCILVSKVTKVKEVRKWCKELQAAAKTEDGKRELFEWDEWIRNLIEINRPYLAEKSKRHFFNSLADERMINNG